MATVQSAPQTINDYVRKVSESDPKTALEIIMAETERVRRSAEIAAIEHREQSEVVFGPNGLQATNMAGIWRMAKLFSESDLVPDHFKRKPANCFIAIQMAMRCKVDPFAFLQKCYIVHGRPAIETQLAVAMANSSGIFKGRIHYEMSGDGDKRQCRAWASIKDSDEIVEETVSIKMAKDMGWWDKKDRHGNLSSLWPKMPELMLKYRAAMWLIRTNAPEVLMGLLSKEEAVDTVGSEFGTQEQLPRGLDDLTNRLNGTSSQNGNGEAAQDASSETADAEQTESASATDEQAETQQSDSQAQNPPQSDKPDVDTLLANLSDELGNADAILQVAAIASRYLDSAPDEETKGLVTKMCEERRNEIRAARGGKGAA